MVPRNFLKINNLNLQANSQFTCYETGKPILIILCQVRPNILWICTDQQRFDTILALGNDHAQTPHLDKLIGQGTTFNNAYCQSPVCAPSRASFLTGRYPRTTRCQAEWSVHPCG